MIDGPEPSLSRRYGAAYLQNCMLFTVSFESRRISFTASSSG
jgi:hypothetical protein